MALTQLVEYHTFNVRVMGSSPISHTMSVGLRSCSIAEVWVPCSKPTQYRAAWMLYMPYKLKQMTEETNEMMYAVMF